MSFVGCTHALLILVVASPESALAQQVSRTSVVARGTFEVELEPAGEADTRDGVSLARMSLSKRYAGDLEGTAEGEMLTALTPIDGSAVYVAIERVTGTLHGRSGSFVLHHRGVMDRGAQRLEIAIAPDSGTGDLTGIAGIFTLEIVEGEHRYELEYSLPS